MPGNYLRVFFGGKLAHFPFGCCGVIVFKKPLVHVSSRVHAFSSPMRLPPLVFFQMNKGHVYEGKPAERKCRLEQAHTIFLLDNSLS